MTFAAALDRAQRSYDRSEPVDSRTDDEIEQDAADQQEKRRISALMAVPRNNAIWDLLDMKRGMK